MLPNVSTVIDEDESHHVLISCIDECTEADEEDIDEDDCYVLTESSRRSQVVKQIYRYSQTGGQPFVAKKSLAMKFASGDSGAAHDSDQLEMLSLNLTEW